VSGVKLQYKLAQTRPVNIARMQWWSVALRF